MKGLSHYIMGLAIATCFPLAVNKAVTEGSLIILLGGMFGIMADTLDFRFAKFMEPHDYEVDPDPDHLNPQLIARKMAEAIDEAWLKQKTVQILFHTMKMSADLWRQYGLTIDTENQKIICRIGPLVTTGKSPLPETEPPMELRFGEWPFQANVLHTYDRENTVDIFSGPDFAFVPEDDHIRVDFIPFHRKWTHSLTFPFLLMPIGFMIYGGFNEMGFTAAFIILFAYWGHALLDQTGMMGSNLFPPFTHKRSKGLSLTRSADAIGNTFSNYMCLMLIIWNINYFSPTQFIGSTFVRVLGVTGFWPKYFVGLLNIYCYYVFPVLIPLYIFSKLWMKHVWEHPDDERKMTKEEQAQIEMIQAVEKFEST